MIKLNKFYFMGVNRLKQVIKYGWNHAEEIKISANKSFNYKLKIFFDIIYSIVR